MSDRDHEPRQSGRMTAADILLLVLAVFLPPLVAFLKRGCGSQLLLNILLDFLGWVPGVIHAWYLVVATPGARH